MAVSKISKSFGVLAILFLVSIPFFANYYFSKSSTNEVFEGVRERKADSLFTDESKVYGDTIVLLKGDDVVIGRHKLVFERVENKVIFFDHYLLELDAQYAYKHSIPESEAIQGGPAGDLSFRLLSVSSSKLKLKLINTE